MQVLMFGWEFPPHISGGLGTACYGITKGLTDLGVGIVFVVPRMKESPGDSTVRHISVSDIPVHEHAKNGTLMDQLEMRTVASPLRPYSTGAKTDGIFSPGSLSETVMQTISGDYGSDLLSEVARYGRAAAYLAGEKTFDIIHGHDWMTVPGCLEAKRVSGRPYIYHVHALEFDRCGENIDRRVSDIERNGLERADHVISVSHLTKNAMVKRYGISPDKITVVHNAVSRYEGTKRFNVTKLPGGKTVLFLGRITFQKGPDYFIEAAARVLSQIPDVTFIMAGSGDMMPRMIERVAELGIGRCFHFTGFLRGDEVEKIYAMSDLYVMPSVSEPFGIAPLEAMLYDVPVIISKQSGVAEILRHALKVDFWDVKEMAAKIIAVFKYPALAEEMVSRSREEIQRIHWGEAAQKITSVYRRVCS